MAGVNGASLSAAGSASASVSAKELVLVGNSLPSNVNGLFSCAVELTNPPSAASRVTVGSIRNNQFWFRGGGTSGLTDGVQVVFTP